MAENSVKQRGTGKPFQPGQSGNPGGRPKGMAGLAAYIKEKTKNGQTLVDTMMKVAEGKEVYGHKPKLENILDATNWLADRGFGKPVQAIDANVNTNRVTLNDLLDDENGVGGTD